VTSIPARTWANSYLAPTIAAGRSIVVSRPGGTGHEQADARLREDLH